MRASGTQCGLSGPFKTESSRRVVPIGQSTIDVIAEQLCMHPHKPDETVFAVKKVNPCLLVMCRGVFGRLLTPATWV